MKSTIQFYLALLLRRIHWTILIFAIFTVGAFTIAKILPPVFVSTSRLLVEPPQIPTQLAASTVQTSASEELQIIEQRLMTRVNLIEVARSENVFEDVDSMSPDAIVAAMRSATTIRRSTGRNQATLMTLIFQSNRSSVAARVVNRYVTLILQDNVENRTDQATETLEFFEVEVDRLSGELAKQSALILEFNDNNADALPSTLAFRLSQQNNVQSRISTLERDIANLRDQRDRLVEVFQSTGTVSQTTTTAQTPEQLALAQLEGQLNAALAIYTPENPKVKLLEAQVAQQTEIVRQQAGLTAGPTDDASPSSVLDVQLASIDTRISIFETDLENNQQILGQIVETIERTPSVQIRLNALNRDYSNIQSQYNNAVAGLARAATGERIELLSKGQRISVIDPATIADRPSSPNRPLIAAGGSVFGLILGIAFALGLELLNGSIRRPIEITRGLGITPLATIPYVRTPMELVARRASVLTAVLLIAVGIPALIFAIHTYYMPLDLLYNQVASRVGALL